MESERLRKKAEKRRSRPPKPVFQDEEDTERGPMLRRLVDRLIRKTAKEGKTECTLKFRDLNPRRHIYVAALHVAPEMERDLRVLKRYVEDPARGTFTFTFVRADSVHNVRCENWHGDHWYADETWVDFDIRITF